MRISDWSSDVCSSDLVGVFEELQVEQPPPQQLVGLAPGAALDPVAGRAVLQRLPVAATGGGEHLQAVAQLRQRPQLGERQPRTRVAPAMDFTVDEVYHRGIDIGSASRREGVGQEVSISGDAVSL